jgi:hypothetical protein
MAQIVEIDRGNHVSGLCDSDTGANCVTEKVVDVTEDCPGASKGERAVLLFTRATRGRIVQICRPYEGEVYMGTHIHFFVDELDQEMYAAPRDDTFGSTAKRLGLTKPALRELIEAQAPN